MVVLIISKKGSSLQERAFLLKDASEVEVVRALAMRLGVFLQDFDFRLAGEMAL